MDSAESAVTATRNRALLSWYRASARSLPWRATSDPYHILVAEVMLQQTQADRVAPRYERFLRRFPDVATLAGAPLSAVLEEWSGLGYNGRARRLRDAARIIAVRGWPRDPEGLRVLPGVGPYTAAAVACFGFGYRVPAVDTNLKRVLSRWHGAVLTGRALETAAAAALDSDASAWNQAAMDLGATVCRPKPRCDECPVRRWCADPEVYEPPRPQGRFEGSHRQRRGAVVRALMTRPMHLERLAAEIDHDIPRVADAVAGLVEDGLVVASADGNLSLAE